MSRADLDERAAQLRAAGEPFVRARVVLAHRPTSAKPGDEAIVRADGSIEGFVGGTCAESTVRVQSLRLLDAPTPLLLRIRPDAEPAAPDGRREADGTLTVHNPCLSGGAMEIFLDPVVPPPLVAVHGDGPLADAIAAVARAAGYRCGGAADGRAPADGLPPADAVVVASHGRDETTVLCAALDAQVPYVGLVASRRRGAAVLAQIVAERPDLADVVGQVDTPAGLDLGGRTAGEIAISVLAAIVRARAGTPRRSRAALIIYAGADQLTPNVTVEPDVNDFIRAGIHTAPGDNCADDGAPNVPGGTEINDFGRADVDDPRGKVRPGTATDPVCGMTVATVPASLHVEAAGRTVWFCGPGCLQAFQSDPDRYPES